MAKKTTPQKAPAVSRKPAIVSPQPSDVSPERVRLVLAPCAKCGAEVEAVGEPTQQPHDGTVIVRQRVRCTEPSCAQIAMQRDVLPAG